jgi:ureidoacrylate peracid hydrolase
MHKIEIPEHIVERVKARRGKLSIYDTVAARQTALLVIDLQNAFMLPGMPSYLAGGVEIVPNVNRLAAALRAKGGTVVWTKHTYDQAWTVYNDFSGPDHLQAVRKAYKAGHVGHELHSSLAVDPVDLIIEKRRFSAFIHGSSDLESRLRNRDINTVIITGLASNACCECTARDAMMLNFQTVFVSDANCAKSDEEHNATLGNIFRLFGDVATTNDVISRLR